ncbi:MAG: hypothetical protein Q8O89_04705 [Nanoarchaeota archaeon]|nr:hypothetical protein [Nanoarchaeota archaeon]
MAKQKQSSAKIRRKIWVEILAPEMLGNAHVGETFVYEPQETVGKNITVNLMTVTKDPKKQNSEVGLEVIGVQNNVAVTKIKSYMMAPSAVKRMLRRRGDRISDSFSFITADAKLVRIKFFLVSRAPTSASIRAMLRNEARYLLTDVVRKISFENLIRDVISMKFQTYVKESLSKAFPLQFCDVKYVGLEIKRSNDKHEQVAESEYAAPRVKKDIAALNSKKMSAALENDSVASDEEEDESESDEETESSGEESTDNPESEQPEESSDANQDR